MAILTGTQVTMYTDLTATAAEIEASGLIAVVQERINMICNNQFTTDLYIRGTVTFNATARTIVSGTSWDTIGVISGDEVYVYRSYRNDGYYTVSSVTTTTLTLATGSTVVDELSGRSVLVSVVQWPQDLVYAAAQMIRYDYSERGTRTGLSSRSLGPWSESYAEVGDGEYGYPRDMLAALYDHKIVRVM